MGTLYVVATPIGNMQDLTPRATRVLADVELIACEDTRHTGMLLKRLGISRPLVSLHAFNEVSRIGPILEALDRGNVALVSDAGTPGISDPGAIIVRAAANAGFSIVPVPGPSSLAAAMSVSGFPPSPVCFLGFLSRKASERESQLRHALSSNAATFFFESPRRIKRLLEQIASIDPEREIVVCRELTKLHEEVLRGQVSDIQLELAARETIRGEFVLGVAPRTPGQDVAAESLDSMIARELAVGGSLSAVAKRVSATTGAPRSEVYAIARGLKERQTTS